MESIYETIEENNILLEELDIDNNAYFIEINNTPAIMLSNNLRGAEKNLAVAEEVAHYCVGVSPTQPFNNDYSNRLIRSRNEYRAFKWMQGNLLPAGIENLEYGSILDIAEEFNVTPEFVQKTIQYRKENQNGWNFSNAQE